MKKIIFTAAITALAATASRAQNTATYCDLVVYRNFLKNYVAEMHVDGNKKARLTVLKDQQGKKVKFTSEADAVNYVTKQGWELVTAYHNHGAETHFYLKKNMG